MRKFAKAAVGCVAPGCALAALGGAVALAAPTTTQFTLSGNVATPGTYTLPDLQALPSTIVDATYKTGGTTVSDQYTGVLIWNLLNDAGGVTVDPALKNDILRSYVLTTGSDGYRAVVSLGEIDPKFGNQQDIVAYGDTGGQLGPSGPDAVARLVLPKDVYGGRYVSNIASIQVGTAPQVAVPPGGGISSSLTASGQVQHPTTLNLAGLQALPAVQLTATYQGPTGSVTDKYTGVSLWTLLNQLGLITDPTVKNDVLNKIVVATGSDGYEAVFSLGEIDPMFGDQDDIVAYADTLGQLGPGGPDGFARMVVPGDSAGGRYVSNLVSLEVLDTSVPEPAGVALLALPLLGLALVRISPSRDALRDSYISKR